MTEAEVVRLAHQARFSLEADEIDRFRVQLAAVLQQMSVLAELTEAKAEAGTADPDEGVRLRFDESSGDRLELPVAELSDHLTAGFFTVPRFIGDGRTP